MSSKYSVFSGQDDFTLIPFRQSNNNLFDKAVNKIIFTGGYASERKVKTFFKNKIDKFSSIYTNVDKELITLAVYDAYLHKPDGSTVQEEDIRKQLDLYINTYSIDNYSLLDLVKKKSEEQGKTEVKITTHPFIEEKKDSVFSFSSMKDKFVKTVSPLRGFFRNPDKLAENIYSTDTNDDRSKHKQVLAAFFYDVVDKGKYYYASNKGVFEKDVAYVLNQYFSDNKLFSDKTEAKITGREAVRVFYSLLDKYNVVYKPQINSLKRELSSPFSFGPKQKGFAQEQGYKKYTSGEQVRNRFLQASNIALGIKKAAVDWTRQTKEALFTSIKNTGIYEGGELSIDFANKQERHEAYLDVKKKQVVNEAVAYIKNTPWYKEDKTGKVIFDAFGVQRLVSNTFLLKNIEKGFEKQEVKKNRIYAAVVQDAFGNRVVKTYIYDEEGKLTGVQEFGKQKKKKKLFAPLRKTVYDSFFPSEKNEEVEDEDRYYSRQHKGFFYRNEKDHLYYFEDEQGNISEVPGITHHIAHFVGGAYDEPYSETNLVGKKKGKAEFFSSEAQVNGTAIHALVNKYYRTGRMLPTTSAEKKKENVEQALYIIAELEKRYPKKDGWEINTENLINSPIWKNKAASAAERFATSIDILVINKRTHIADFLDIKTGNLKSLQNKRKVQYQLSAEAYFYLTEFNKYTKQEDRLALGNLRSISLNKKNKFIPKVVVKEYPFVGEKELERLFSAEFKNKEAGAAFKREKVFHNLDINPTLIKDVNPFAVKTARELFPGAKPLLGKSVYKRKMVSLDLETTGTSRDKYEIQSFSYAIFDVDEETQKAYPNKISESFFLVSDESYLSQEAQNVHHITNARVLEMMPNARKITSADIENFMELAEGGVLTGHNILNFDLPVLRMNYIRVLFEEGNTGKQVASKLREFDRKIAASSIFDTFSFYRAAPIPKQMSEILASYNKYDESIRGFYEGLKNSEIFQAYNKRYFHLDFDPSKLHSSTYDMLLSAVIAVEALFGRHPDKSIRNRASAILKQLFKNPLTLLEIANNGDAFSLFQTNPAFILNEPEISLRTGIKYFTSEQVTSGLITDELIKEATTKYSPALFTNPVRIAEYNGYLFFYNKDILDNEFPGNLSDKELGEILYRYMLEDKNGAGSINKRLLQVGVYDIINLRSINMASITDSRDSADVLKEILTALQTGEANLFTRTATVKGVLDEILEKSGKLTQTQRDLAANLFMHDALTATNLEDFDLAQAQVLKMYTSPRTRKKVSEKLAAVRERRFFNPETRSDRLYEALRKSKAPLSLYTSFNTEEFMGSNASFNKLLSSINKGGQLNTILASNGLALNENDWKKVISTDNPLSLLEDKALLNELGERHDTNRTKAIKQLQKKYNLSDNAVTTLNEYAKVKHPLEDFNDKLEEIGSSAQDAAEKLNSVLHGLSGIGSVPIYDPEQLLHAGYRQIGGIHTSLKGLVPNFLNTSVTKLLTGSVQDYEYAWQRPKQFITLAKPLLGVGASVIGGAMGGPAGAMVGSQIGLGTGAWITQLIGTRFERTINEAGLFFSSRFNKMGALLTPAIYALNLFTKALKIASVPLLAGLGSGLYMYKRALNNMGTLDTPLYNLTGINYGMGYNQFSRLDYTFGMRRGTTNSIIEGVEFAKQGLLSLGRYDKNKLISSALLGIFNEAYMNPGDGASNYASMTSKLYENYQNSKNKGRFMYLLNEYNPELAKQLQIRTEYESFLASDRGAPYRNRRYYYNDINRDQRNEFRAITGIQSSFGESIQNSFMKIAAALYNWKGFDFMNRYTSVIGNAADAFAGGDINGGFKIIGDGIIDFIDNLGKTWAEVKEKLGMSDLKDTILTYGKIIYHEIKLKLIDLGLFVTDIFGKIKDPAKGFFMMLYEQFKKLFDFVGSIRLDIDMKRVLKGDVGGFQFKVGYGSQENPSYSHEDTWQKMEAYGKEAWTFGTHGAEDRLWKAYGIDPVQFYKDPSIRNNETFRYMENSFKEIAYVLEAMKRAGYDINSVQDLDTFLTNAQVDSPFNYLNTDIVKSVAWKLGIEPASSKLSLFEDALSSVLSSLGVKDPASVIQNKLEEAKEKESKLIIELKNQDGRTESKEIILGQQTGIVEVFGPNWKFGVR